MTREKAVVPSAGLMVDNMLANGEPENSTVRELILVLRDKESQVCGRTARRLNGLKPMRHKHDKYNEQKLINMDEDYQSPKIKIPICC